MVQVSKPRSMLDRKPSVRGALGKQDESHRFLTPKSRGTIRGNHGLAHLTDRRFMCRLPGDVRTRNTQPRRWNPYPDVASPYPPTKSQRSNHAHVTLPQLRCDKSNLIQCFLKNDGIGLALRQRRPGVDLEQGCTSQHFHCGASTQQRGKKLRIVHRGRVNKGEFLRCRGHRPLRRDEQPRQELKSSKRLMGVNNPFEHTDVLTQRTLFCRTDMLTHEGDVDGIVVGGGQVGRSAQVGKHVKHEIRPGQGPCVEGHGHATWSRKTNGRLVLHSPMIPGCPCCAIRRYGGPLIVMPRVLSSLPLLAITVLIACGESESGDSDVNDGLDGGMDAPNVPSLPDVGMDANRMDIGLEDRPGISVDASLEASSDASDAKDSETDGPVEAGSDAADGSALDGSFDGGLVEHLACYYGDFDTEATYQLACLAFPGPLRSLVDALELQDTQILSATFAPHANEIALAVRDAPDAPIRLVIINLDDTTKSFELLAAPSADREVTDLAYSSDGTWLGFIADFELAGTRSMYVVALSGGLARRVSPTPEPGRDVVGFAWSDSTLTSSWLAYTGDLTAAGGARSLDDRCVDAQHRLRRRLSAMPTSTKGMCRRI